MSMAKRSITFNGTNIMKKFPLMYSDFEEKVPEPKVVQVEIPAGPDIDITESLGPISFHNGTHIFKFFMYTNNLQEELAAFKAFVHGRRKTYNLSWDAGYVYTGRWAITNIDYRTEESAVITVSVDRYPWKIKPSETVELVAHPSASFRLTGSERYGNLTAVIKQPATIRINTGTSVRYEAGTVHVAGQLIGDTNILISMDNWYYYLDGENMIPNSEYYTQSGTNAEFSSPQFSIVGTDLYCPDEANQHVSLTYTRKDL